MKTKCLKLDDTCQLNNLYYDICINSKINSKINTAKNIKQYIYGLIWKYIFIIKTNITELNNKCKTFFYNTKYGKYIINKRLKAERDLFNKSIIYVMQNIKDIDPNTFKKIHILIEENIYNENELFKRISKIMDEAPKKEECEKIYNNSDYYKSYIDIILPGQTSNCNPYETFPYENVKNNVNNTLLELVKK